MKMLLNILNKNRAGLRKLGASIISTIFVIVIYLTAHFLFDFNKFEPFVLISVFFFYNILCTILDKEKRHIGLALMNMAWDKNHSFARHFVRIIFYTLSFATVFIWIKFPFDLFLFNILVVQNIFVHKTGTNLHGWIAGIASVDKK